MSNVIFGSMDVFVSTISLWEDGVDLWLGGGLVRVCIEGCSVVMFMVM